mmetsp:Transcript_36005/g.31772  ORF Transcript_36005/g.31772 Transcript_36005/m.31772 type:complete len:213 (-) Transcript_36005:690-1328(-)|eukprot:CAMPEP_0201597342 /NCGR_PEP_ID=MMETSP0190_2-20130828/193883_1 /ASSEMBLY_ACC=CAM_ASM_000263 /TAXON_ID=37353 /ORGANISM="Rosalina sp." /LENGTH=212 /DNA_ID=CAMNT_0048058319 /DNA_START=632 /DNA_END=1270 /DNA_ORIENTATION=-
MSLTTIEDEMSPIHQLPIDPSNNDDMKVMDLIIEFAIHNDMAATMSEVCIQISDNNLTQLRRCTIKSMIIFYVRTIIMMDHRNLLQNSLQMLQKLYSISENMDKKVYKAFEALMRGMKYQIILYNLETKTNGSLIALKIIDEYFPQITDNEKDKKIRQILINFCNKHQKNILYKATSYGAFKKWTKSSFKILLRNIGEPVLEQIAKKRMERQ